MDEKTLNEYIQKLPKSLQKVIYNGLWEHKTIEIGKKYSLSDSQIESLINIVILFIVGLEKPETFQQVLISDLGISDLLAEQIVNDLDNRLFDYIAKENENKNPQSVDATFEDTTNLNEISNKSNKDINVSVPNYTPRPKVVIDNEPVQTPIPVPRFKAVPMSDIESGQDFMPKVAPKPSVGGIMQSKLNTVTEKAPARPPVPEKYSVDPYREPLN